MEFQDKKQFNKSSTPPHCWDKQEDKLKFLGL